MTTLDKKAAFLHVIDSHRWLTASGCAWNLAGANTTGATRKEVHRFIPNVDVMIRDCLLLHARSLIKFYLNEKRSDTDIIIGDFVTLPQCAVDADLKRYGKAAELHLLHLTDHRDDDCRKKNPTVQGLPTDRPNWDLEIPRIVDKVHSRLEFAANGSGSWREAFRELHAASVKRYQDKSFQWPHDLCERPDVERWLTGLGL